MKKLPKKLRLATDTVRLLTVALSNARGGCDTGSITTEGVLPTSHKTCDTLTCETCP